MKRAVFFMLAVFIVSISMYGDIGKGDWTQEEINYFKTKEYKGDKINYNFARKWVPPYVLPNLTEIEFMGLAGNEEEAVSKLISIGKLDKNTEFRYLSLLRNEIYARNGYIFKDARLKAFFNQMPWYKPISEDVQLNRHEKYNIRKIKKIEKELVDLKEINPDTFPERYKGRIIIDAKWGKRPREFGRVPYPKSDPPVGPSNFCVNGRGNIYVLDRINNRVQVFDSKGTFQRQIRYNKNEISDSLAGFIDIAADDEGHIFLLGSLDYPSKGGIISVFGNDGEYLGKIKLYIGLFATLFEKWGIKNGYFFQVIGAIDEFHVEDGNLILRFGDSVYPVVDIHLLQSERKGFLLRKFSIKQPLNFYTSLEKTTLKKVKRIKKWAHLIGRDKKGDFFIRESINEILKYSDTGELLAKITISISQTEYDMGRDLFISDEGAIYYWTNDNYGVKIIKLSKRGE